MTTFMEDNLDMPLSQVLALIQHRIMSQSRYMGIQTLKSPMDWWTYQEIIYEMEPDVIVEIGNHCGGSTLALAHYCDALDRGKETFLITWNPKDYLRRK